MSGTMKSIVFHSFHRPYYYYYSFYLFIKTDKR
jgi:hypothetical protein